MKDCCTKIFLFQRVGGVAQQQTAKLWKALGSISSNAKTKTNKNKGGGKRLFKTYHFKLMCVHTHIHDPHTHDPELILRNTVL